MKNPLGEFDWKALERWHDRQDCNAHDEGLDCCVDRLLEADPGYRAAQEAKEERRRKKVRRQLAALPEGEWLTWAEIKRRTGVAYADLDGVVEWRKRESRPGEVVPEEAWLHREAWCDDDGNIHERFVVDEARVISEGAA